MLILKKNQPFVSLKKSIKINNNNTNRAIDVTGNNCASPSRFCDLNCDEGSNNVLDDEINISNVLKTRHNGTTRPIQNAVQNPRRSPVVVHNSPQNQHHFRRLKTAPRENLYSEVVKDHKRNENNIVIFSDSIANFNRYTKAKINNSIRKGRVRLRNFRGATSGERLHNVDTTLAEGNYDTAIVHCGVNNIINSDSSRNFSIKLGKNCDKIEKIWN